MIAEGETEVIVMDKKAFTEVLTAEPVILELLLDALEKRGDPLKAGHLLLSFLAARRISGL